MKEGRDLVKCPYCGIETPEENLLCIYCGRSLNLRTGFSRGIWFALMACALLVALVIWLL